MEVFPAEVLLSGASVAVADAVAGDAVADAFDAAELFDVDMDQLTGPLALVSLGGRAGIN